MCVCVWGGVSVSLLLYVCDWKYIGPYSPPWQAFSQSWMNRTFCRRHSEDIQPCCYDGLYYRSSIPVLVISNKRCGYHWSCFSLTLLSQCHSVNPDHTCQVKKWILKVFWFRSARLHRGVLTETAVYMSWASLFQQLSGSPHLMPMFSHLESRYRFSLIVVSEHRVRRWCSGASVWWYCNRHGIWSWFSITPSVTRFCVWPSVILR